MERQRGHLPHSVVTTSSALRIKALTLGDPGVGKSCLIKRYCEGRFCSGAPVADVVKLFCGEFSHGLNLWTCIEQKFISEYISTIGIDYGVKGIVMGDTEVKVNFWDVAGDPAYFEVRNEFYRDTQGAMLVFDVGSRRTFEALDSWCQEFSKYVDDKVHVVLVGNKVDNANRIVSESEGKQWAEKMGYAYFETSAQSGRGVQDMFDSFFSKIVGGIKKQ